MALFGGHLPVTLVEDGRYFVHDNTPRFHAISLNLLNPVYQDYISISDQLWQKFPSLWSF